jgi:DNA-binding PadR family transcriptional regulator
MGNGNGIHRDGSLKGRWVRMGENLVLTEAVYYILLSLVKARHGYGIMQMAEELSGGRVRLAAGTLYGALNSLCRKGWIEALPERDDSRKKEYKITADGFEVLRRELARLRQLVENGESVLTSYTVAVSPDDLPESGRHKTLVRGGLEDGEKDG